MRIQELLRKKAEVEGEIDLKIKENVELFSKGVTNVEDYNSKYLELKEDESENIDGLSALEAMEVINSYLGSTSETESIGAVTTIIKTDSCREDDYLEIEGTYVATSYYSPFVSDVFMKEKKVSAYLYILKDEIHKRAVELSEDTWTYVHFAIPKMDIINMFLEGGMNWDTVVKLHYKNLIKKD